jgi:hypothetical protein
MKSNESNRIDVVKLITICNRILNLSRQLQNLLCRSSAVEKHTEKLLHPR